MVLREGADGRISNPGLSVGYPGTHGAQVGVLLRRTGAQVEEAAAGEERGRGGQRVSLQVTPPGRRGGSPGRLEGGGRVPDRTLEVRGEVAKT